MSYVPGSRNCWFDDDPKQSQAQGSQNSPVSYVPGSPDSLVSYVPGFKTLKYFVSQNSPVSYVPGSRKTWPPENPK